jgi:hypothetical protein
MYKGGHRGSHRGGEIPWPHPAGAGGQGDSISRSTVGRGQSRVVRRMGCRGQTRMREDKGARAAHPHARWDMQPRSPGFAWSAATRTPRDARTRSLVVSHIKNSSRTPDAPSLHGIISRACSRGELSRDCRATAAPPHHVSSTRCTGSPSLRAVAAYTLQQRSGLARPVPAEAERLRSLIDYPRLMRCPAGLPDVGSARMRRCRRPT